MPQDYQQARQLFEKAAAAGNPSGAINLGRMYQFGLGVRQDYQHARQWYEKAATAGDKEAQDLLKSLSQ